MSWTKVIAINLAVLLGLLVVLELSWIIYDKTLRSKVRCDLDWVLYNYCPNIKTTRLNHADDGGKLIKIETDDLGGRVQIGSNSTFQKAKKFLIGDSFIQADEIEYQDTIYGLWNSKIDNAAYSLGYSSWNPIQYFDAIKRIGKADSHYYVFLMTNDVMPSYERSVSVELAREKTILMLNFIRETLTYKVLSRVKRSVFNLQKNKELESEGNKFEISTNAFSVKDYQDCTPLSKIKDSNYSRRLGFDYLVFSKKYDCWPVVHKKTFDEFLSVTKDIERYVINDLNSKITFVWVGAGWAHRNQASKGRLANAYGFSADISVTQKGLVDEFEKRFNKSDIIDTEKVIATAISSCSQDCEDKYFFAVDGHWTPETHKLVLSSLRHTDSINE
jgi:hypothetical protein